MMEWDPDYEELPGVGLEVFAKQNWRLSEVLGPDGEPLMVGYERPKVGFDLTPRNSNIKT